MGKRVTTGTSKICIENISPGGIAFSSNLNLPTDSMLVYEVTFSILEKEYKFEMTVLRREQDEYGYRYGAKFYLDEVTQWDFIKELNRLAIFLKKQPTLKSCSFCSEDKLLCFMRDA